MIDRLVLTAVNERRRRLLTRPELHQLGLTDHHIAGRVASGRWIQVQEGVYLIGNGDLTWKETVHAAVLAAGDARAAQISSIRLWDVADRGNLVEIKVEHSDHPMPHGCIVHRTRRLQPASVRHGIPCTGFEETLLDCAAKTPARDLHRWLTTAWRRGFTSPDKLEQYIREYGGRGVRGTRRLRSVVQVYLGHARGPGSPAESDLLVALLPALEAAGIEMPVFQHKIDLPRGEKAVVDQAWPGRLKVIEMEGVDAHGNAVVTADDIEREAAVEAAGWDYRRVSAIAIRDRARATVRSLLRFLGADLTLYA